MSHRPTTLWVAFASYLVIALLLFIGCSKSSPEKAEILPETFRPKRQIAASPERCVKCHDQQHSDWLKSHHAVANRLLDLAVDSPAFSAPVADGESTPTAPSVSGNSLQLPPKKPGGEPVEAKGVLGYHPLRQYLVEKKGNRLQTHALSYDPEKDEWFDMFENDGREAGEWGHWSNQGMNWNSNCAWCHMTEFDKNYDIASDTYHSEWTAQAISCLQCHSQSIEHADAAEKGNAYVSANPYGKADTQLAMQNCATCHSRRDELTGGDFVAGDFYDDHYGLSLPDRDGLYFADFKAREENYVYASLQLSSMGHAGVTCIDCHNPHSGDFVAPKENNALCLQCHSTGKLNAPLIQPTAHSRHSEGSAGNSCIECHMPTRNYMARDPRHDHGFTIPDPQLTAELGVPNACSQCHTDQDLDWATAAFENWYPTPTVEARREHARMMAQAWDPSQPLPSDALLKAYHDTENPYRKTTYLRILANAGMLPENLGTDSDPSESPDAVLRIAAARLLANDTNQMDRLRELAADPRRNVRIEATQAILNRDPDSDVDRSELDQYFESNADRPQMRLQLAQQASLAGDSETAFNHVRTAASFDSFNSGVYYQGAIALASGGFLESAQVFLSTALPEAKTDGWVDYSEGLIWGERQDYNRSLSSLQKAVDKDPSQDRWWYNLIAAQMRTGNQVAAMTTLQRALALHPNSEALRSLIPAQRR